MNLTQLTAQLKEQNTNWWIDIHTGELIALIHSEVSLWKETKLSECLEGVRKNLMDDHLPHRTMEEVELADALIRILDYCGGYDIDIESAVMEKMAYNRERADHKLENRRSENGKRF